MDYECHLVPADRLIVNPIGIQEPLCNDCRCPDCTNPIKDQMVSVVGVNKKLRLWVVNNQVRIVVACKGYIGDQDVQVGRDPKPGEA